MIDSYPREFIEAAVTRTRPTQNQQSTFQHGGGRGPELPHTTEELLAVDGFWGREGQLFKRTAQYSRVYGYLTRTGRLLKERKGAQNWDGGERRGR